MFLQNCFCKTKEQSYHYLFITKPLTIEEDRNDEWDGMTGTVLKAVRINHKTVTEQAAANFQENKDQIKATKEQVKAT